MKETKKKKEKERPVLYRIYIQDIIWSRINI